MQFGIILLIFIGILYMLLIKGYLWKLIITIFGVIGMYWALGEYIPASKTTTVITIGSLNLSWAFTIPFIVLLLAMACTKIED